MGSRIKRIDSYGEESDNPYEKKDIDLSNEDEETKDVKQPVWPKK